MQTLMSARCLNTATAMRFARTISVLLVASVNWPMQVMDSSVTKKTEVSAWSLRILLCWPENPFCK